MALLLARLRPQPYPVFIYFAALAAGLIVTWASAGLLYLFVEKPMSLTCERQGADIRVTVLTAFSWWLRRSRAGAETSGNL